MTRFDWGLVAAGASWPLAALTADHPALVTLLLPTVGFCLWVAFSRPPKRRFSR